MIKKDQKNSHISPEIVHESDKVVTVGFLSQYMSEFMSDFKADFKAELMVDIKMQIAPIKRGIEVMIEELDMVKSDILAIKADILEIKADLQAFKEEMRAGMEDIRSMFRHIMRYIDVNEEDKAVTNKRLDRLESRLLLA